MSERFGKIPLNLLLGPGQSLRRNAADTGFESCDPGGSSPHTHPESDVTNLQTDLSGKALATHAHAETDVTNLTTDLSGKAPTVHTHTENNITGLELDLAGKAAAIHSHAQADVTGLVTDLAGKAASTHAHAQTDVTGLVTALAGKEPANSNIQTHVTSAHAPSNAQKNSDILKAEIEAVLTGVISSHSHAGGGGSNELWEGKVHVAMFDGNPNGEPITSLSSNATLSPTVTPTNITATVGRIVAFRFKTPVTVTAIRWYGIAAVAGIYTAAIYRDSDGARLWSPGAISTLANAWGNNAAGGLPITFAADTLYWFGIGANTTGTTAGFCTPALPRVAAYGLAAPAFAGLSTVGLRFAQVALTAGAWPATLPAKANAGAWTGFIPIFYLCAAGQ